MPETEWTDVPDLRLPLSMFTVWLARGERGISSEAIVSQLTGEHIGRFAVGHDDHPYDPSGLRRCMQLLDQHPLAQKMFPGVMANRSPEWAALDAVWEELTGLLREEMRAGTGSAPRTYARMKEVLARTKL